MQLFEAIDRARAFIVNGLTYGLVVLVMLLAFNCDTSRADEVDYPGDAAIFGGARAVKPNVLVIYDTSGSMLKTPSGGFNWGSFGTQTKDYIASHALTDKILANKKITDKIRLGLMVFDLDSYWDWHAPFLHIFTDGGEILVPIDDFDSGGVHLDQLKKAFSDSRDYYKNRANTLIGKFIGSVWDDIIQDVTNTPLAESLAEAGLYFGGQPSWNRASSVPGVYESGFKYKSPVQYRCQQNYVIILTDGLPTDDDGDSHNDYGNILTRDPYMYSGGGNIGDRDGDGYYLDDVSKFLYNTDLLHGTEPSGQHYSFDRPDFPIQNIMTSTIGFNVSGSDSDIARAKALLLETAKNGNGLYYEANGQVDLENAFSSIINMIYNGAYIYSASAVPASSSSMYFSGNSVYVPMFIPSTSGLWLGNLRKYAIDPQGALYDVKGNAAVVPSTGLFTETAKDFWADSDVSGADYSKANYGGAGSVLKAKTTARSNLYTYTTVGSVTGVTQVSNSIPPKTFGLSASDSPSVAEKADRDELVSFLTCSGDYNPASTSAKKRSWILGDIMHSIPATLTISNNQNAIFVGSNDGFLHCFSDGYTTDSWRDDNGNSILDPSEITDDSSVTEQWAFAPPELLPKFKKLHPELRKSGTDNYLKHYFYVDGTPVLYKYRMAASGVSANTYTLGEARDTSLIDTGTRLIFGLRRGGASYTILDILDGTSLRSVPQYVSINQSSLITALKTSITSLSGMASTNLADYLGGSWSTPMLAMVKDDGLNGVYSYRKVIFLAGGYDEAEDTIDASGEKTSTRLKGSCAYALDAASGNVFAVFSHKDMLDSIVDLAVFDRNNDRIADTLYAPDLGGRLWRFQASGKGNVWTATKIFEPSGERTYPLKFFNAPDVVLEPGYEYLFIGSGNREDPLRINNSTLGGSVTVRDFNQERFYALKFRNQVKPLTEDDTVGLRDITDVSYASQAASIQTNANGWYLRLTAPGEKVINRAVTVRGVVFFTTYQPFSNTGYAAGTDLCSPKVQNGVTRLYAINYRNGNAVKPTKEFETDTDPFYSSGLNDDRSLVLGQAGLPPQPSLVVTDNGMSLVVGSKAIPLSIPSVATAYYWHYLD